MEVMVDIFICILKFKLVFYKNINFFYLNNNNIYYYKEY